MGAIKPRNENSWKAKSVCIKMRIITNLKLKMITYTAVNTDEEIYINLLEPTKCIILYNSTNTTLA